MTTTDNGDAPATAVELTDDLTPTDRELARLLARGLSYSDAGDIIGASKSSVARRMQDPQFRAAVNRQRAVGVSEVLAGQAAGAELSVAYLTEIVSDDSRPDNIRVRAASALVANLPRWRGHEALPTTAMTPAEMRAELLRRFIVMRERQLQQLSGQ